MGATLALSMANLGAAYGTAKAGIGIASMGVLKPDLIVKSLIPIIMAGILGIYGLIIAVIIVGSTDYDNMTMYMGFKFFASGICCGFSSLGAGLAIGIVGDTGVRATAQEPKTFVGLILIMIFAEALALYGFIVGIILTQ